MGGGGAGNLSVVLLGEALLQGVGVGKGWFVEVEGIVVDAGRGLVRLREVSIII